MAVYKKTYRPYDGALTARWTRLAVIPRYAFEDMHRSRFLTIFFLASFIYPLICALMIYVRHNASALSLLGVQGANRLISINATFFLTLLGWQSMLALFLASFIGPGQVSPDLANNALSLYLARPVLARRVRARQDVGPAGPAVPDDLGPRPAALRAARLPRKAGRGCTTTPHGVGIFFGAWVWILVLALLALALSAWVKWKPAAGALMFGVFFVAAGFGAAINGVQRTNWGHLFNISYLIGSVWVTVRGRGQDHQRRASSSALPQGEELPIWCSWAALVVLCLICLYMLARKIRGAEVVR